MTIQTDFDAIVIGAGFAGIYMLRKLRDDLGLKVRAFDKAGGVGGTWYWNRYPGCLSDTEAFVYCYSFDRDLLQERDWDTRYVTQPQILSYLEHVVDRFGLRDDIQLNTGITAAHFDDARNIWEIRTDTGDTYTARYLITALGVLAATNVPTIAGSETFAGEQYHTGAWPEHVELDGKRVGVIGTGSTGLQLVTAIAPRVKHLSVFQRSPQYSVPVANRPVSKEEVAAVKENYDQIWEDVRNSLVAFGFKEGLVPAMSVSEDERQAVFQKAWDDGGGFRFMFGTFNDIAIDPAANEAAASFVRSKIAQIVKDPETARKLTPVDLYAKRPLCDGGYYATFNRDNVSLIDVTANPIAELTPKGVKTADGEEHELDVLIFATGFEAVDGNYTKVDIRGRGGKSLKDHWHTAPTGYLGVATADFPNMFMMLGPYGPFSNIPPTIETQVEWVADLIGHAYQRGVTVIEARRDVEEEWASTCKAIAAQTLFPQAKSWIFGTNIPGKPHRVMFYLAGLVNYREVIRNEAAQGYPSFDLLGAKGAADREDPLKALYAGWSAALANNPQMGLDEMRALFDHWGDETSEPDSVDYVDVDAGGVPALRVRPKGVRDDAMLIALHGGGFVVGSSYSHRKLFGHIAKAVGCETLIVDYRRAPEHPHPAASSDAAAAYAWVLKQGIAPEKIAFIGDSAGGSLAITALLRARQLGLPLPAAAVALSPFLDLELNGESYQRNAAADALVSRGIAAGMVAAFLGEGGSPVDPSANPLHADLSGLPPILVQASSDEALVDDAVAFDRRARAAGVDCTLELEPGQQHVFQFLAGVSSPADAAIGRIAAWLRPRLGLG